MHGQGHTPLTGEFHRVPEKVDQYLTQSTRITKKVIRDRRIDIHNQGEAFRSGIRRNQPGSFRGHISHIDFDQFKLQTTCFNFG